MERLEWTTECQCQCGGQKEHWIRKKQLWTKQKVDCGQLNNFAAFVWSHVNVTNGNCPLGNGFIHL